MAQDYGLLTNMASGIREAGLLYQTIKNQNRQADQIDRQQKLDELKQGVQRNAAGDYELSPYAQAQRDYQTQLAGHQMKELGRSERLEDPNSDESKAARGFGVGLLGPDAASYIPDSMSGTQLKEYTPMIDAKLRADAAQFTAESMAPDRHATTQADVEMKRQQAAKLRADTDRITKEADPKSLESAAARGLLRAMLPPEKASAISDDMTGTQAKEYIGLISQQTKNTTQKEVQQEKNQGTLDNTALKAKFKGAGGGGVNSKETMQALRMAGNDPVLKAYVPRLDGAKKMMNLLDAAEKGDVASNNALLQQLNAEQARLETGSQAPGLNASEKTEMNDARARLANVYDTLTGKVTSVNLADKFKQARSMLTDLSDSFMDQVDNRMTYLKAGGTPSTQKVFDEKHKALQDIYTKQFGHWGHQAAAPSGLISASKGPPPVGTIQGGYKFKGGDPSKKENWEAQ